ncbi:keratocan-like [Saccoglossus kowalevskii]|uniref:Reticulon-4 receptor-like n=1 Tax=Saccoglossus kowalevskii TaxID=10224 RepID=A0ABM0MQ77_SACKO|nr:PREDICTED: reticulon-4 receptor-like [Saccoglossus kowalevskii]
MRHQYSTAYFTVLLIASTTHAWQEWKGICPENCLCVTAPDEALFANCKSQGLKTVPRHFPAEADTIDLSYNEIEEISKDTFNTNLPKLYSLNLGFNRISHIDDDAFESLGSLGELIMQGNFIRRLSPRIFTGLNYLQTLFIGFCPNLESLENGVFSHLPNLVVLFASNSSIKEIGDSSLSGTTLQFINLAFNHLQRMPNITGLENVHLYLEGNRIETVNPAYMHEISTIGSIELNRNQLRTIPLNVIQVLKFYEVSNPVSFWLNVQDNPWVCDCDMKRVVDVWPTMPMFLDNTITCAFPTKLRGMNLWDVPPQELCRTFIKDSEQVEIFEYEAPTEEVYEAGSADGPDDVNLTFIIVASISSAVGTVLLTLAVIGAVVWCRRKK